MSANDVQHRLRKRKTPSLTEKHGEFRPFAALIAIKRKGIIKQCAEKKKGVVDSWNCGLLFCTGKDCASKEKVGTIPSEKQL